MPKFTNFSKERSAEGGDPGFRLPGFKLRWVSGDVSENRSSRPWAIIRKSDLPAELVKHLEDRNPDMFKGAETIRRGNLVLAFTTDQANDGIKSDNVRAARDLESRVKLAPDLGKSGKSKAKVTVNEDQDVTQDMLEQFKHAKKA
jgi:hypothetical protein